MIVFVFAGEHCMERTGINNNSKNQIFKSTAENFQLNWLFSGQQLQKYCFKGD